MHSCGVLKNTMLEGSVTVSISPVCRGFQLTYVLAHTILVNSQIKIYGRVYSLSYMPTPVIASISATFSSYHG